MDKTRISQMLIFALVFSFSLETLHWEVWVSCCLLTTKWPCKGRNSQLQVVFRNNCCSAHVQRNRTVQGLSFEESLALFRCFSASCLLQCDCLTNRLIISNSAYICIHYKYMSIAKIGQQSYSSEFLKVHTRDLNTACVFVFGPHMNYYYML